MQDSEVPPEDDVVIVPAPPTEALAHVPPSHAPLRAVATRSNTLFLRQTLIPVLLTLGLILPGVVALGFLSEPTSPYSVLKQRWFAIPFLGIGLVMLGLAIVTMLQVKHELERATPRK